jgi:hypothetical protein
LGGRRRKRLEDKGRVQIIYRRHADLPIWVKREFETEDGGDSFTELGAFGSEDLQNFPVSADLIIMRRGENKPVISAKASSPSASPLPPTPSTPY